jgi:WD40 repeat protein
MLPDFIKQENTAAVSCRNSFAGMLGEDYHFEVKNGTTPTDVRSLFYYEPERTLLISHAGSNRVHILNLETGKLRWFDHHGTSVRSVRAKNDLIVTGSWDGSIGLTSFESLRLLNRMTEKSMGRCPDAIFSPENDFAYSFTYDTDKDPLYTSNNVRQWNNSNGTLEKVLYLPGEHLNRRRCGSCEVFGNNLYVVSDTGRITIYDSRSWNLVAEESCPELLTTLCIIPSLNNLAVGSTEGSIFLCDLNTLKIKNKYYAHRDSLNQFFIHPANPEIMISAGFDGIVNIWRLPEFELAGSVNTNGERLWSVAVVNNMLVTGGECGDILIYDINKLNKPKLKGTLVISDKSYSYISEEKKSFYASDLSSISVKRDNDGILITNKFSEYLLTTTSDFNTLRKLFRKDDQENSTKGVNGNGLYQLG